MKVACVFVIACLQLTESSQHQLPMIRARNAEKRIGATPYLHSNAQRFIGDGTQKRLHNPDWGTPGAFHCIVDVKPTPNTAGLLAYHD